jgi:hypothetical protein
MNPLKWIRGLTKAAAMNGIHDCLKELTPDGVESPADVAQWLVKLEAATRMPSLPAMADGPRRKPAVRQGELTSVGHDS